MLGNRTMRLGRTDRGGAILSRIVGLIYERSRLARRPAEQFLEPLSLVFEKSL